MPPCSVARKLGDVHLTPYNTSGRTIMDSTMIPTGFTETPTHVEKESKGNKESEQKMLGKAST